MKAKLHARGKRALGLVLALAMLATMLVISQVGAGAAVAPGNLTLAQVYEVTEPTGLTFIAPETIWLDFDTASITSTSAGSSNTTFEFSNIEGTKTDKSGKIYFSYPGATGMTLTAQTVNPSTGATVDGIDASTRLVSGTASPAYFFGTITNAGGVYQATMKGYGRDDIAADTTPGRYLGFSVPQNDFKVIEWTMTFNYNGATGLTAKAYSVVRAPSTEVGGAAITNKPHAGSWTQVYNSGIYAILGLNAVRCFDVANASERENGTTTALQLTSRLWGSSGSINSGSRYNNNGWDTWTACYWLSDVSGAWKNDPFASGLHEASPSDTLQRDLINRTATWAGNHNNTYGDSDGNENQAYTIKKGPTRGLQQGIREVIARSEGGTIAYDMFAGAANIDAGDLYVDSSRFSDLNQVPGLRAAFIQTDADAGQAGTPGFYRDAFGWGRWRNTTTTPIDNAADTHLSFLSPTNAKGNMLRRISNGENGPNSPRIRRGTEGIYFWSDFREWWYDDTINNNSNTTNATVNIGTEKKAGGPSRAIGSGSGSETFIVGGGDVRMGTIGTTNVTLEGDSAYKVGITVIRTDKATLRDNLLAIEKSGTPATGSPLATTLGAGKAYVRLPDQFIGNATTFNANLRNAMVRLGNPANTNATWTAVPTQTPATVTFNTTYYNLSVRDSDGKPTVIDAFTTGPQNPKTYTVTMGSMVKTKVIDLAEFTCEYAVGGPTADVYVHGDGVEALNMIAYTGSPLVTNGWKFYYEAAKFYVIKYANGGGTATGSVADSPVLDKDDSYTLSDGTGMTKAGYTFGGWSVTIPLPAPHTITFPAGLAASKLINDYAGIWSSAAGTAIDPKVTTLTAVWNAANTYRVNCYNTDPTTHAASTTYLVSTDAYVPGATVNLGDLPAYTAAGYTFAGWSTTPGGTAITGPTYAFPTNPTPGTASTSFAADGSLKLYAVWSQNTHSLTFKRNYSGTDTTEWVFAGTTNGKVGDSIASVIGAAVEERTGYTFGGWNRVSGDATTEPSYAHAPATMPDLGATPCTAVYAAVWTPITSTVNWNLNYPGGGFLGSSFATYDLPLALPTPEPTRTGYLFGGWYKEAACTTPAPGTVDFWTSTTFYAKWTDIKYQVVLEQRPSLGSPGPELSIGGPFSVDEVVEFTLPDYGQPFKNYWVIDPAGAGSSPVPKVVGGSWDGTTWTYTVKTPSAGTKIKLIAIYDGEAVGLTFDPNEGKFGPNAGPGESDGLLTTSTKINDVFDLSGAAFDAYRVSKHGHTFTGWKVTAGDGKFETAPGSGVFTSDTCPAAMDCAYKAGSHDTTLEAQWEKETLIDPLPPLVVPFDDYDPDDPSTYNPPPPPSGDPDGPGGWPVTGDGDPDEILWPPRDPETGDPIAWPPDITLPEYGDPYDGLPPLGCYNEWHFLGYYEPTGRRVVNGDASQLARGEVLSVVFARKYSLTYNANGGVTDRGLAVASGIGAVFGEEISFACSVTANRTTHSNYFPSATKSDNEFQGWYTNASGGERLFANNVTGNPTGAATVRRGDEFVTGVIALAPGAPAPGGPTYWAQWSHNRTWWDDVTEWFNNKYGTTGYNIPGWVYTKDLPTCLKTGLGISLPFLGAIGYRIAKISTWHRSTLVFWGLMGLMCLPLAWIFSCAWTVVRPIMPSWWPQWTWHPFGIGIWLWY